MLRSKVKRLADLSSTTMSGLKGELGKGLITDDIPKWSHP